VILPQWNSITQRGRLEAKMTGNRYVLFKSGSRPASSRLSRFLRFLLFRIFPQANPDFENSYARVLYWWLEIDENDQVQREIGFDSNQRPVVLAPFGDNFGIFTDLNGFPNPTGSEIDSIVFENEWEAAWQSAENALGRKVARDA
jgi:hypothetical protein